jgi:hypothetical protein
MVLPLATYVVLGLGGFGLVPSNCVLGHFNLAALHCCRTLSVCLVVCLFVAVSCFLCYGLMAILLRHIINQCNNNVITITELL